MYLKLIHNLIVETKMKNKASNRIQQKNSRQIIFESYKQKNSPQINFQSYIDTVKEDKISWNFFINLMRDLSHTNIDRLKTLNEILLNELKISIDEKRYKSPTEKIENLKVYILNMMILKMPLKMWNLIMKTAR